MSFVAVFFMHTTVCEQLTVATATKETVPMGAFLEMGYNEHVKNRSTIAKPQGIRTRLTLNFSLQTQGAAAFQKSGNTTSSQKPSLIT